MPPLARVIVKVVFTGSDSIAAIPIEAAIVPLPMPPVKLVVPARAKLVKSEDGFKVAFTVNVVLIVAAGAAAPTSSAKARVENVRFIVF